MDAAALLRSQGWRGKGYTLHSSDNSVGLASRLLVSNNTDRRGIGQNQHHTNDQWWLTAFDEKLKSLDTSQKGRVVQSGTGGKLDAIAAAATGKGKYAGANGLRMLPLLVKSTNQYPGWKTDQGGAQRSMEDH
ncbi:hypothetical protein P8C59_008119 [Phyllachora maydis]|uniref:Uncharacterized protein n=1 Tax=Phyllachora maydis TaxID=1825666 RepID=A0AAD9MGD2_9PEZI|nr:hypothetical protein P8C59_008119 [Phyllachora maydis]